MRNLKVIVLTAASLLLFAFMGSAEMTVMSLQERNGRADTVVIGTVKEVRQTDAGVGGQFPPSVTHWLATCHVERYIRAKIHNPNVEEGKKVSIIHVAFEQMTAQKPAPVKLVAGAQYLLFLKETGPNEYEMITPYHGAFEAGQDHFVHDEQSPEYPQAVKMSFEEIVRLVSPRDSAPEPSQTLTLTIQPDKKV